MQETELIIAYLRGELSAPQAQEFAGQLAGDPELQSAVREYQIILEGFKGMQHEAFVSVAAGWETEGEADEEILQIIAYLEGRLAEEERLAFEQRMADEPALSQMAADYRRLLQGFKRLRQDDFAAGLQEWAKELPAIPAGSKTKVVAMRPKRKGWWRYVAAASVLVLVVAGILLFLPNRGGQHALTAFLEANYIPPASAVTRGAEEELFTRASRSFDRGDYAQAAELLERVQEQDSLFVQARYLQGHSYYQLGQYRQAVTAFTQSLEPSPGVPYDRGLFNPDNAAWTRILAQLQLIERGLGSETLLKQDLQTFISRFMQQANRSDTYYRKGEELEGLLVDSY